MICAHLLGVIHLIALVCECINFSTESFRKHYGVVTKASDTDNTDALAGACTVAHKWREHCEPGA